ncbi:MAG TPA: membrane dipeptidase, partial [Deinococcales bacterium]|nr:membrane dipeptidase [Deinococcales bacterium]
DQLRAIRDSDGLVGVNLSVSELRPDGYLEANTSLDEAVRQFDHLVQILGIDRVGFGTDLDGATIPQEVGDAAGLQRVVAALRAHGYGQPEIEKLAHGNWLRVLRQTWGG